MKSLEVARLYEVWQWLRFEIWRQRQQELEAELEHSRWLARERSVRFPFNDSDSSDYEGIGYRSLLDSIGYETDSD